MIKTIENDFLVAKINETGAELYSLVSKKTGREYVWQGDPEYWKGRSPVLFPICGRLYKGKYVYDGKEYEMLIHGIAKTADFTSRAISDSEIEFTLSADEKTNLIYPFDFVFTVKYSLIGNRLITGYTIKNTDKKVMPFSFGAHPGFNVPFVQGETFEDYYVKFGKKVLSKIVLSENGLNLNRKEEFLTDGKKLRLKHELFGADALFFETKKGKVRLQSEKTPDYVEVSYNNMTCLGLWHTPKKDAPYVCIEPWHGIPADEGKTDDFSTKKQMLNLKPQRTFYNEYTIKIKEF